jgi:hypothetical protein
MPERCLVLIDGGYLNKITTHFSTGTQPFKLDLNQFAITLGKSKEYGLMAYITIPLHHFKVQNLLQVK